jgi:hypothetical protein
MSHTSHIPEPWNRRYVIARILLVLVFIAAGIYFAFLVLFPSQSSLFDFKNPQASKNTLLDPQTPDGASLEKGNVTSTVPLIIDAALIHGDYSLLNITIIPDKKSALPEGVVTIQKSYRAFLLSEGDAISEENTNTNNFQSGALLSFADGVFLIDGNQVRPIGDAIIFEGLGYHWEDVMPASEEDMGLFEKGKMVILGNMHPNNTVFYDPDMQKYFLIRDGKKHEIVNEAIAKSYLRGTHPIIVSEKSLSTMQSCPLELGGFLIKHYACATPIDTFKNLPGDSYRLSLQFDNNASFQNIQTVFADTVSISNMKTSLSQIKQRIMAHYGAGQ